MPALAKNQSNERIITLCNACEVEGSLHTLLGRLERTTHPERIDRSKSRSSWCSEGRCWCSPKGWLCEKGMDQQKGECTTNTQPMRQLQCKTADLDQIIHMHADACACINNPSSNCKLHTLTQEISTSQDKRWLARAVRTKGEVRQFKENLPLAICRIECRSCIPRVSQINSTVTMLETTLPGHRKYHQQGLRMLVAGRAAKLGM